MKKGILIYRTSVIIIVLLALSSFFSTINSQPIDDELRKNASTIINNYSAIFTQSDNNNANYNVSVSITILNKEGDPFSYFYTYDDKFRNLVSFSGTIKNAFGNTIKKIKKSDLSISTFSEGSLATDNKTFIYNFQSPSYPYTIEYTYEEKWKNGIISYPRFSPVRGYSVAVNSAELVVNIPADKNLRYKTNFGCEIENTKGKYNTYSFRLTGFKALKKEPLSPSYEKVFPYALISPNDFCYDSFCGNMTDWKNYGLWMNELLKGRDKISVSLTEKLKQLTQDIPDNKDKVKAVYEYLQKHTRYVSIQLGIGGLRPFEASIVEKTGFGDCKGLTNFMKAMLTSIGIPSYYCEISMGEEKQLHADFANVNQTNHVILLVPLKNDSIWLECTSQTLPFGYIHKNIAGYDALILDENGGKICKLPEYSIDQHRNSSKLTIDIENNGSASGNIYFKENLHTYGKVYRIYRDNEREKLVKHINTYVNMPSLQIKNIIAREENTSLPFAELEATFAAKDFANVTGSRIFIPISPLKKGNFNIFSSSEREQYIELPSGYSESDTIIFNIPESYTLESQPKDVHIKTPYGILNTKMEKRDNRIIYIQDIDVFAGEYNKSEYPELKLFFNQISNTIAQKLVIKQVK